MSNYLYSVEELSKVLGKIPEHIWEIDNQELYIKFFDGYVLKMYHEQDCCETVVIEDVAGDWSDLVGKPLLVADIRTSREDPNIETVNNYWDDSNTWTFYTFRGNGGSVDVRWHGSSNGYYSEEVENYLLPPEIVIKSRITPPQ